MAGYLISSAFLILALLRQSSVRLISFVLVAVSGYQFVQPSSELFAATLLCLFLVCAVQRSSVWLASLLLVGYGFCKVDSSYPVWFSRGIGFGPSVATRRGGC